VPSRYTPPPPYSEVGFQHKIQGEGENTEIDFMACLAESFLHIFHAVYEASKGNRIYYLSCLQMFKFWLCVRFI